MAISITAHQLVEADATDYIILYSRSRWSGLKGLRDVSTFNCQFSVINTSATVTGVGNGEKVCQFQSRKTGTCSRNSVIGPQFRDE